MTPYCTCTHPRGQHTLSGAGACTNCDCQRYQARIAKPVPEEWVENRQWVEARDGQGNPVGQGFVIAYTERPTVTIELDGDRLNWIADMCVATEPPTMDFKPGGTMQYGMVLTEASPVGPSGIGPGYARFQPWTRTEDDVRSVILPYEDWVNQGRPTAITAQMGRGRD